MMRSSHSLLDIPEILKDITIRHPTIELIYARPGIPFEQIAGLFVKRIDSTLGKNAMPTLSPKPHAMADDFGVIMIAHGDVPLEYLGVQPRDGGQAHRGLVGYGGQMAAYGGERSAFL